MLGDKTETHASLYAVADIIPPALDEHLAADGLQVTSDISDDDLRQVAEWCANLLNWYENHEVDTAAFSGRVPAPDRPRN